METKFIDLDITGADVVNNNKNNEPGHHWS